MALVENILTCTETGELPALVKTWLDSEYAGGGTGAVTSVNGEVGVVVLDKYDIGLGSVDNTADAEKNVLSATKLTTARTINGTSFDGTSNITIPTTDASKEPVIAPGSTAQYWRGDKTWVSLDKVAVGLGNVDNTSDASKPVSTAQQTALNLKAPLASPAFTGTPTGITKAHVGLSNVDNTADSAKNVLSATKLTTPRAINGVNFDGTGNITVADATKEPTVTAGTTAQYYRGDKTWQTLDKVAVGLSSADNTADAAKNVLSATKLTTARTINGVSFDGTANVTVPATDSTKEPTIAAGTTAQYWRGDKSWQTLDKAAVGLDSVDNTADSAKNVLSATKLTTARTIGGVSFDGTANIALTSASVGLGNVDNTSDATKNSAATTLTNKRVTPRVVSVASNATHTINVDTTDLFVVTAQAAAAAFAAPTGTPTEGQVVKVRIKDNGTARGLSWNAIFISSGAATLPVTTVVNKTHNLLFQYDAVAVKYVLLAVDSVGY